MWQRVLDVVDRNRPWKAFGHGSRAYTLYKLLPALTGGAVTAYYAALPWLGKILVGLGIAGVLLWIINQILVAIAKARSLPDQREPSEASKRSSVASTRDQSPIQQGNRNTQNTYYGPVNASPDTDRWPRITLGVNKSTKYGFFVANHGPVEARAIQLRQSLSNHYKLTSDVIPLLPAQSIQMALCLYAGLINPNDTPEWTDKHSGADAFNVVAIGRNRFVATESSNAGGPNTKGQRYR